MNKEALIFALLNIGFICLDEDPREASMKAAVKENPEWGLNLLKDYQKRWSSSPSTLKWISEFEKDKTYESFHTAGHFLVVDKIIHWLRTGEGENMAYSIEHALGCGVVPNSVYEALMSLANQAKAA